MKTFVTLGLGALAMYFLDPQHGRNRRALVRERIADLRNRYGSIAETHGAVNTELEPDRPTDTPQGAHHLGR